MEVLDARLNAVEGFHIANYIPGELLNLPVEEPQTYVIIQQLKDRSVIDGSRRFTNLTKDDVISRTDKIPDNLRPQLATFLNDNQNPFAKKGPTLTVVNAGANHWSNYVGDVKVNTNIVNNSNTKTNLSSSTAQNIQQPIENNNNTSQLKEETLEDKYKATIENIDSAIRRLDEIYNELLAELQNEHPNKDDENFAVKSRELRFYRRKELSFLEELRFWINLDVSKKSFNEKDFNDRCLNLSHLVERVEQLRPLYEYYKQISPSTQLATFKSSGTDFSEAQLPSLGVELFEQVGRYIQKENNADDALFARYSSVANQISKKDSQDIPSLRELNTIYNSYHNMLVSLQASIGKDLDSKAFDQNKYAEYMEDFSYLKFKAWVDIGSLEHGLKNPVAAKKDFETFVHQHIDRYFLLLSWYYNFELFAKRTVIDSTEFNKMMDGLKKQIDAASAADTPADKYEDYKKECLRIINLYEKHLPYKYAEVARQNNSGQLQDKAIALRDRVDKFMSANKGILEIHVSGKEESPKTNAITKINQDAAKYSERLIVLLKNLILYDTVTQDIYEKLEADFLLLIAKTEKKYNVWLAPQKVKFESQKVIPNENEMTQDELYQRLMKEYNLSLHNLNQISRDFDDNISKHYPGDERNEGLHQELREIYQVEQQKLNDIRNAYSNDYKAKKDLNFKEHMKAFVDVSQERQKVFNELTNQPLQSKIAIVRGYLDRTYEKLSQARLPKPPSKYNSAEEGAIRNAEIKRMYEIYLSALEALNALSDKVTGVTSDGAIAAEIEKIRDDVIKNFAPFRTLSEITPQAATPGTSVPKLTDNKLDEYFKSYTESGPILALKDQGEEWWNQQYQAAIEAAEREGTEKFAREKTEKGLENWLNIGRSPGRWIEYSFFNKGNVWIQESVAEKLDKALAAKIQLQDIAKYKGKNK